MVSTAFSFQSQESKFSLHNALALAQASALAYQSEAAIKDFARSQWGMEQFKFIDVTDPKRLIFSGKSDTQVFIAANQDVIIAAFRGTEPNNRSDWKTDFRFKKTDVFLPNSDAVLKVHRGFWHALNITWSQFFETLQTFRTHNQPIWLTGHSLGGALASLAAFRLHYFTDFSFQGLYTFGQPRVGSWAFCNFVNYELRERIFRFANNNDFVTFVPPFGFGYAHLGQLYYLTAKGSLIRNGFSLPGAVLDRIAGFRDFGKLDHDIATYIHLIEKNLEMS